MTISCLICAHSTNYEYDHLLKRAILSVIQQSRTINELILVLDSCWINTENFIRELIREHDIKIPIKIIHHQKSGLANAKNFGIQHCTGDYVAFCDADDYWHNTKIEIQEKFILANPRYDIIATESWDVYPNGFIYPNCFEIGQYQSNEDIVLALQAGINPVCHGSVIIKKEVLINNPYPDIRGIEDFSLWKNLASKWHKFYKIPERLYYWSHSTSVSR